MFAAAVLLVLTLAVFTGALAEEMKAITLADGGSASTAEGVVVDGDIIRIMKTGEYLISGSLTNGQISVECDQEGKVKLFLNGVNIHNETGPAILVSGGLNRATISLVDATENVLSDGESLHLTDKDKEPNGVIFSRSDLTISGSGSLTVQAGALDGIVSKDDLRIKDGHVSVTAPRHGVRGKDYVQISAATLNIKAGKDGIRSTADDREDRGYIEASDSTIEIACGDDAFYYVTRLTILNTSVNCVPTDPDE